MFNNLFAGNFSGGDGTASNHPHLGGFDDISERDQQQQQQLIQMQLLVDQTRNELLLLQNRNAYLEQQHESSETLREDLQLQLQLEQDQQQQQQQARKKRKLPTNVVASSICQHCGNPSNSTPTAPAPPTAPTPVKVVLTGLDRPPLFAARENPISLPHGEIDGRSNAQMAWEHRYQLLKSFKLEYGHLRVTTTATKNVHPKYSRLADWIMKQRQLYRNFTLNRVSKNGRLTQERIDRLTTLGLKWRNDPLPIDRWQEIFDKLVQFHATYGHCCLLALAENENHEGFDFVELKRFTLHNRGWLQAIQKGATHSTLIDGKGNFYEEEHDEKHNDNGDGSEDDDKEEEEDGTVDDDDEEEQEKGGEQEQKKKKTTKKKKKREVRHALPRYWSEDLRHQLLSLKCDYMESAEHRTSLDKTKLRLKLGVNTSKWYTHLEEFRDFFNEHGHGFVETKNNVASKPSQASGLGQWTKEQRTIYDAMNMKSTSTTTTTRSTTRMEEEEEENNMDDDDDDDAIHKEVNGGTSSTIIREENRIIYERNIAFLKSIGFCFDREVLQARQDRILKEQAEKLAAEKKKQSSLGQLEAAQKEKETSREVMKKARASLKEAELEIKEANKLLAQKTKAVKAAEQLVADDPIGKHVLIKPRGNKPSGLAIVVDMHSTKVVDETVLFYDVEFLHDGAATAKEFAVNELLVVHGSLSELEAIAHLGMQASTRSTSSSPPRTAKNNPPPQETSDTDKLYKLVKEAEQTFAAAIKGNLVYVRPRGETKPFGIAKVEAIWPTKIAKDYILMYDVEYPLGEKEKGINGVFVVCGTLLELNALVVAKGNTASGGQPLVVPQLPSTIEPDLLKMRRLEKETVGRFMEAQKGKHVFVKYNGTRKPGGLAVVDGISPRMTTTGYYEIFYSVKYVGRNGTKESGIPQTLVTTGTISALKSL